MYLEVSNRRNSNASEGQVRLIPRAIRIFHPVDEMTIFEIPKVPSPENATLRSSAAIWMDRLLQNRQCAQGEIASRRLDGPNCPKTHFSVDWHLSGDFTWNAVSRATQPMSDFVTPQKCSGLTLLTARPLPEGHAELTSWMPSV